MDKSSDEENEEPVEESSILDTNDPIPDGKMYLHKGGYCHPQYQELS